MKLLKATTAKCTACGGSGLNAGARCRNCNGRGYFLNDRSYETEPKPDPKKIKRNAAAASRQRVKVRQRMEDGVCVGCGDPQLETQRRCAKCAEYHRKTNR